MTRNRIIVLVLANVTALASIPPLVADAFVSYAQKDLTPRTEFVEDIY